MVEEFIESIIKKHNGEIEIASTNFTVGAGETVSVEHILKPETHFFYILTISGYVTEDGVKVTFFDQDNIPRWTWTEFPDTFVSFEIVPFIEKKYSGTVRFEYTNNSSATSTCSLCVKYLAIPGSNVDEFERDIKELANFVKTLKEINENLKFIRVLGR